MKPLTEEQECEPRAGGELSFTGQRPEENPEQRQGVREHRGWLWIGMGVVALGAYGFVATLQPDAHFGRILAAYGGVFVAGSLAWGMVVDKFRPDRYDIIGAVICLAGVGVIMYFPRAG